MPTLDDLNLMRCPRCGKLFGKEPSKRQCRQCSGAPDAAAEESSKRFVMNQSALHFGLPLELIEAAVQKTARQQKGIPETVDPCVRCGEREAVEGRDLCVNCNLDLHHRFGMAARDLFGRFGVQSEPSRGPSVAAALEDKRARTATSRINPVGMPRIKY